MRIERTHCHWISWVGIFCLFSLVQSASATVLPQPQGLLHELLSESVPTAFAPMEVEEVDFEASWDGAAIPGVQFRLEAGSLQWTRVNELLALPRARLILDVPKVESGEATTGAIADYAGFTTPFGANAQGGLHAELVVALISDSENRVEVRLLRGGKELNGRLRLHFKGAPRVALDPSCSKFAFQAEVTRPLAQGQWVYIGCRSVVAGAGETRTPNLEVYVFWDQAGRNLEVEGLKTAPIAPATWSFRVAAEQKAIHLRVPGPEGKDGSELQLSYSVPKRLHFGSLGVGIGPYSYSFDAMGKTAFDTRPLVTLYGSFFVSDGIRLVGFNATSVGSLGFTDMGLYLHSENFRIVDRRLSISLLLGGHAIGFLAGDDSYLLFGLPQGVEMIYSDFLQRGANLSIGGFVYPNISGKAYNNVWIRWGGKFFFEVNYILWEEVVREQRVYSRSLGVSLGFPIVQFF